MTKQYMLPGGSYINESSAKDYQVGPVYVNETSGGTGAGSLTFAFTTAGVGAALIAGAGASTFSFTTAGVGAALIAGAGAASFSFTTAGVGAALIAGAGAASFSFTTAGVGAALIAGAGAASVGFTATGGGASLIAGAGSSAFAFSATAAAGDLDAGDGAASFGFLASGVGASITAPVVPPVALGGGGGVGTSGLESWQQVPRGQERTRRGFLRPATLAATAQLGTARFRIVPLAPDAPPPVPRAPAPPATPILRPAPPPPVPTIPGRLAPATLHADAGIGAATFRLTRRGRLQLARLQARADVYHPTRRLRRAEEAVLLSGGDVGAGLLLVSELRRSGLL